MNLDKYIRVMLMMLSKKYKVTIVEIIVGIDGKVSKNYSVSFEQDNEGEMSKHTERFKNKRELVSWLMCQK